MAVITVTYHVNAKGEFYCQIPEPVLDYFATGKTYGESVLCSVNRGGNLTLFCSELQPITNVLDSALIAANKPEVTEEHLIRYNIESHVSFAQTPEGEVCPNAGYPNAKWVLSGAGAEMYGDHYASRPAKGGYSLCIGARAVTKITRKVGDKSSIEYQDYYKGESHLGMDNPAQKLNSWSSFTLPEDAKEIPYSDEAALCFHSLMMGMAQLSKRVQEATFEPAKLMEVINNTSGNFALPLMT